MEQLRNPYDEAYMEDIRKDEAIAAANSTISAAIDSLKSALYHLKQSNLDTEGGYGLHQVESTLLNLERRRGK